MRFNIAYGRFRWLLRLIGMPERFAYIDVDDTTVTFRMSWGFKATIPRSSITEVESLDRKVISIGVHGWWGRWLVNGAADRLVRIAIDPPERSARVMFFPVKLRELTASVENRAEFVQTLSTA